MANSKLATIVSTRKNEIHCVRAISEYIIFMSIPSEDGISEDKFLVHDSGDIVDSSIKLLYRPASLRSLEGRCDNTMPEYRLHPPSQGLRIFWLLATAR